MKGVFVTCLLGRYTAISGEYLGHRLVRLPGPRGWLLIALLIFEMLGAPLGWVAIARPCGDLIHFMTDRYLGGSIQESVWENLFTSFFTDLPLTLGLRISFDRLEKQQLAIVTILVIGTGNSHEDMGYLPDDPEGIRRLKRSLLPMRWVVGIGAIVLFLVTAAFMLSGAVVLYPLETQFKGWSLLTEQAHVWNNIHPTLVWVSITSASSPPSGARCRPCPKSTPALRRNSSPPYGPNTIGIICRLSG